MNERTYSIGHESIGTRVLSLATYTYWRTCLRYDVQFQPELLERVQANVPSRFISCHNENKHNQSPINHISTTVAVVYAPPPQKI